MSTVCKVDGCNLRVNTRGWCRHHYESWLHDVFAMRWAGEVRHQPVVCDCRVSTPERIALFDAWQCSVCYRKCDAPATAVAS